MKDHKIQAEPSYLLSKEFPYLFLKFKEERQKFLGDLSAKKKEGQHLLYKINLHNFQKLLIFIEKEFLRLL